MANKMFYTKRISETTELCLVYGWVGDDMYNLFIRDIKTKNTIIDIGTMSSVKALEFFNAAEGYGE